MQMKPDVIIDIGNITPTYVSTAERGQSLANYAQKVLSPTYNIAQKFTESPH